MTRSLRSLLLCVVGVLPPLLAAAGPARAESLVADGFVKGLTIAQCSGLAGRMLANPARRLINALNLPEHVALKC